MTPLTTSNVCINVKWQNFQVHLASEMSKLLHKESMVDVTLKTDDGESFQAHRIVLSACSPFFQKILSPFDHDFQPIIISLPDVSSSDVKSILEFIYVGEIRLENVNITSVLKTAEDLKIEALIDVKKYLIQTPISSTENNELDITVKTVPNEIPIYCKGPKNAGFSNKKKPNTVPLSNPLKNAAEAMPKNQDARLFNQPNFPVQNSLSLRTEARNILPEINQFKLLHQSNIPIQNSLSDLQNPNLMKSNVPIQKNSMIGTESKKDQQKSNQIKLLHKSKNVFIQKFARINNESVVDQEKPNQIKLLNQSGTPLQNYLRIGTREINDLHKNNQIKVLHQSNGLLPKCSTIVTGAKNDEQKSNQIKKVQPTNEPHLQTKLKLLNNSITSVSHLESHSSLKVHLKKPIPLLETTSKSNSILPPSSFSSIDSASWPLSLSKSLDCSDATTPITFDDMISKPLVEIQEPESLAVDEKFNHKIGSHFLAFGGINGPQKSESICDDSDLQNPALLNKSNPEVHVLQYEDLEGEIMKNEDEPLSPWIILKPPKSHGTESFKENIDHETHDNNSQICIVRPDDFFTQIMDDESVSNAQELTPISLTKTSTLAPSTAVTKTTLSKNDSLKQAVEDVALRKKSLAQSASSYNIPVSTLYYRARSAGVDYNGYMATATEKYSEKMKAAVTLVQEGATLKEACFTFGVSKTGLWRRVQQVLGPRSLTLRSQMKSRYSQMAMRKATMDLKNGVNLAIVSKKYNIPPATLHRIQNKLIDLGILNKLKNQIPRYNKDYTKQERLLKAVKAVKEEQLSTSEACQYFNIPKATLWRKLKYLNKLMETDIEELNLDSLIMEQEEEEDQEFLSFSQDDEASNGEDELMMDEDSQDGEQYVLEDNESTVDHLIQEENESTVDDLMKEENESSVDYLIKEENEITADETTNSPDQSYDVFNTVMDDEKPSTSYYLCSNDMCLKI